MVATIGLTGLRPAAEHVALVTAPPYDVIKKGSRLEALLASRALSLYHVTLGEHPAEAFERLKREGAFVTDDEPCYYVYEQTWSTPGDGRETRTGVFVAAEVTPYADKQIIRHEKTFDDKVKGRIALSRATSHTFGPVFALTRSPIGAVAAKAKSAEPLYTFRTDLDGQNDLHGIESRVWRVPEASALGREIQTTLGTQPFYIADGHHRYHASLLNPQTHALVYVTEEARIQAYDRVVTGVRRFAEVKKELALVPTDTLRTPAKHQFCLYSKEGAYLLDAKEVPTDVVSRLDCSILERELYPKLGLTHSMIQDPKHFDYYPESQLDAMKAVVDRGEYDLAIALHPVSIDELIAVADAGLSNPDIVMPEKSTFFAPKILSGLFVYRHVMRPS
jgi:uncharacterized protein (DUF1015 family)